MIEKTSEPRASIQPVKCENIVVIEKPEAKQASAVTVSKTAAIILVLALGAHSFFEGIAFGLQTSIEGAG